ncbi:Gfo/Idh/MocA family protein [Cytobacillus firmus]|uniref:Gfo/Idh/MocA family protein n=1 Tax=Cytobacillus firmus TaxID=1399 RepID=UPI003002964C
MLKKYSVGIIGAGKIAQVRHIPEYKNNQETEVLAICDKSIARAAEVAKEYLIPHVSVDYLDIVNSPEIDAVSICTPNKDHWPIAVKALKAGKHVLIEKPISTTTAECRDLYRLAAEKKKVIMVGHNQRFSPVHKKVKSLIDQKEIGDIIQFTTNFKHGGPENWSVEGKNTWFLQKDSAQFGVLGDLGIHKIDLFQWFFNDMVKDSKCFTTDNDSNSTEENAVIILKMNKGVIGTISLSWNNPSQDHRSVIYGTKGTIVFGESYFGIEINYHNGKKKNIEVEPVLRNDGFPNSGVIDQFINEISGKCKPCISNKEVENSLETIINLSNTSN